VGQGPINVIALEHLGTFDRGVTLFRRYVRQGIKAVAAGKDPKGFYLDQGDLPPTFANDRVIPLTEVAGSLDDPKVLIDLAEKVGRDYLERSPMAILKAQR
jgi:hypothetical protein